MTGGPWFPGHTRPGVRGSRGPSGERGGGGGGGWGWGGGNLLLELGGASDWIVPFLQLLVQRGQQLALAGPAVLRHLVPCPAPWRHTRQVSGRVDSAALHDGVHSWKQQQPNLQQWRQGRSVQLADATL